MTRIAQESSAQALQYGPTEGFAETKECIREVMRAEGMDPDLDDIIVTTGGQQAIDLVAKTLVDPGDVVICEAPTYPGAVPVFCSYQAETLQVEIDDDGMRIDELEALLDRLAAEGRRPKFVYTVPSFQNPAGVTMSAERRRRLVEIARERELLRGRGQPLRAAALRGRAARAAVQARRRRLRPLPRDLLEDPLARDPARLALRAAAGDGEGGARQAGRRPLHLDPDPVLRPRVLRRGPLARLRRRPLRDLPRAPRRDARRARALLPRAARPGRTPRAGCSAGRRCPSYIDTTDLLAKALRENVAFVPGAAAYVDGRGGSSMRLNFSASRRGRDPRGDQADRRRDRGAGRALRDRSPASTEYPSSPTRPPPRTSRVSRARCCRSPRSR